MGIHWTSLTERYPDAEQCLAGFIAWQAAEVLSHAKPANLINVLDRPLACGRNIRPLWDLYSSQIMAAGELRALELKEKSDRLLVLIYHPANLDKTLQHNAVRKTLGKLGYRYADVDEALEQLRRRMEAEDFPHEIGFFLGYPIKDVLGFMGLCDIPLVGHGPWKMYGKKEASLATLNAHRAARRRVLSNLSANADPIKLLQKKRPACLQAA